MEGCNVNAQMRCAAVIYRAVRFDGMREGEEIFRVSGDVAVRNMNVHRSCSQVCVGTHAGYDTCRKSRVIVLHVIILILD